MMIDHLNQVHARARRVLSSFYYSIILVVLSRTIAVYSLAFHSSVYTNLTTMKYRTDFLHANQIDSRFKTIKQEKIIVTANMMVMLEIVVERCN